MEQSPTCRWRVKNCKIKDEKNSNSEKIIDKDGSVGENIRKSIKQGPLLMGSGSWLVWIGLMECLDNVGCVRKVFRQFPTRGIRGVVEAFPLDQVKQSRLLVTAINPAVQDPVNFPLIGVVQLDRWWWVYGSVGDLTRASGLQQRHMEHRMNV